MCSLITPPSNPPNSWQFARLNSSWCGWSTALHKDPSAFHFFAYIPISTANHTHTLVSPESDTRTKSLIGWQHNTQKPSTFFADLYKQAYSCLDLFIKWPSNIKLDADNAKTGTHRATHMPFPACLKKISSMTSIMSSKNSGSNQTPQLLTLPPPTTLWGVATTWLWFWWLHTSG